MTGDLPDDDYEARVAASKKTWETLRERFKGDPAREARLVELEQHRAAYLQSEGLARKALRESAKLALRKADLLNRIAIRLQSIQELIKAPASNQTVLFFLICCLVFVRVCFSSLRVVIWPNLIVACCLITESSVFANACANRRCA